MRRGLTALALSGALVAGVGVVIAVAPGAQAANSNALPAAATDATGPGTDTQPPTVPANLSGRVTCSLLQVTLSWTASTDNVGVTGYDIFGATSASGPFTQAGTSTTTTSAQSFKYLYYEVRARDAAGNVSAFTAPLMVVPPPCPSPPPSSPPPSSPPPDTQPPTVPTNLTVQFSCTQATLSWSASTDNVGVTGYDIFGASSASGPFTQAGTSTTTTSAQSFKYLYYEVRARDAAGNVSAFTAPVFTPPPPCTQSPSPPPPPAGCTAVYSPVGNPWPGGFQGQVTVTDTGATAIRSWTVTLTFANGQSITQIWGASTTSTASPYTITNLGYNGALNPNASTTFGFLASGNATTTAPTATCASTP